MAKKGPRATHPNRMNITIRCDRDVYLQAREIMEHMPETSLSDVVERFLHEFVGGFRPFIAELKSVESEPEALAVLQQFVAGTLGQASLRFAREVDRVERERDERLAASARGERPYRDLAAEGAARAELEALEAALDRLSRDDPHDCEEQEAEG